jgi:hypothetical protein
MKFISTLNKANMNFQNKLNNGGAKNPTMDLAMVHVS